MFQVTERAAIALQEVLAINNAPPKRGVRLVPTDEGRLGLVSYVMSNNFASLRSVGRMGYRIFGEVYLLRVGGRRLTYATKSCRDYDFRVEPTARPRRGDRSLPRVSGSRESP